MNITPVKLYNNYKKINFTSKKQDSTPKKEKNLVVLYDNAAAEAIKCNRIAGFDSIRPSIQTRGYEIFETYKDNMDFLPIMIYNSKSIIDKNYLAYGYDSITNTAGVIAIYSKKSKTYDTYLENCSILDDNTIEASIAYKINDDGSLDYYDGEIISKDGKIKLSKGERWKFDENGKVLEQCHLNA